ncbi:DUF5819 family protein [Nesterenkonia muleiensis]|uniref:DUF5819 family protein n=1 Tax=Nesterenkonia muleiensis TaxID=2282648 RepID=UPI001300A315|nr:DUF5819 family protein [Nesterenkonia muleiensis]
MSEKHTTSGGAAPYAEQRRQLRALPPVARLLTIPVLAVVLIHTLFIGLWVAPSTPAREAIGQDTVRNYVVPWFDQSWSIFAPNPRSTAITFEVRAWVQDPETSEEFSTQWHELVDHEDDLIRGNPFPPRTSLMVRRSANHLHTSTNDLNEEQVEIANRNVLDDLYSDLREELMEVTSTATSQQVHRHIRADSIATDLASGFAWNAWQDQGDLLYVQFRTSIRSVPEYHSESGASLDEALATEMTYGWRPITQLDDQQISLFAEYLPQEVGQ